MLHAIDRGLAWLAWGLAALVVVLLLAGPGLIGADKGTSAAPASYSGGTGNAARTLFTSNCGSCHTLAAAGTTGTVGPDLDTAAPDAARVREIVTSGSGAMPSFSGRLSDAQIKALAAYVAGAARP
jgi:mono/diheme cytochrome c family protein